MAFRTTALSLVLLACASAAAADILSGTVTTKVRTGAPAATAVVYLEPIAGPAPAAPPRTVTLSQKNKAFSPRVLGIPTGSVVQFPNDDTIFHNVFSRTPGHAFDLGLYRAGQAKTRTFATPGVVRVFCNIHPQMTAFVVTASTPWIATAASDGSWRFDVPPGRYTITALSERATAVTAEVQVMGTTAGPTLVLDESAFAAAPHLNKFGKPYSEAAYKKP